MSDTRFAPVFPVFKPVWRDEFARLDFRVGPYVWAAVPLQVRVSRAVQPTPLAAVDELSRALSLEPLVGDGYLLYANRLAVPLPKTFQVNGLLAYVAHAEPQYTADLTLGSPAYWATFSGKARYNLRRTVRLFQEASGHPLSWHMHRTPEELQAFHTLAQALSVQTYQHKLFNHGLPDTSAFVAHTLTKAAQGQAWGCVLYWRGEVCAYLYFEGDGDVLSWDHAGYSPGLARWSPGTVLMSLAMDVFQSEGRYRFMDFGPGDGQHKALFSTSRHPMATVFVLRSTWKHRLLLASHRVFSAVISTVMDALKRSGFHQWLKKTLRQRVAGETAHIQSPESHDPRAP